MSLVGSAGLCIVVYSVAADSSRAMGMAPWLTRWVSRPPELVRLWFFSGGRTLLYHDTHRRTTILSQLDVRGMQVAHRRRRHTVWPRNGSGRPTRSLERRNKRHDQCTGKQQEILRQVRRNSPPYQHQRQEPVGTHRPA